MSALLISYDLSGGEAYSSGIASPDNVNIAWNVSGNTGEGHVDLTWMIQVDSEPYHELKDSYGKVISAYIDGDESGNLAVNGINATNLKILVSPTSGFDGTLNLYYL